MIIFDATSKNFKISSSIIHLTTLNLNWFENVFAQNIFKLMDDRWLDFKIKYLLQEKY